MTARPWGANAGRLTALPVSLLAYAAAVSRPVQQLSTRGDLRGCVDAHAVQYQLIVAAGLVAGLALGPVLVRAALAAAHALLPAAGDGRRASYLRGVAFTVVAVGAALNALGAGADLNRFLDLHPVLLVELDVVLYGMGFLAGAAWYLLLDRQGWLGLLLTPAMALMLIGSGVVGPGWC